jgi:hypothetical protein
MATKYHGNIAINLPQHLACETHFSNCTYVYVKCDNSFIDNWQQRLFRYMGSKTHVICRCNNMPFIPTNTWHEVNQKCIKCNRIESFVCCSSSCSACLCKKCYGACPIDDVTTIDPADHVIDDGNVCKDNAGTDDDDIIDDSYLGICGDKGDKTMMMNQMDLMILAIYTMISINLLMMMKEMKKFVMIPIYFYSMILALLMKSHKTMLFRIMDFSLPILVIHFATFSIMIIWNGFLDMLFSTRLLFARKDMEGHKYLACSNKGTLFNILCLLHLIAQAHCSTWSLHCSLGSSSIPPLLINFPSLVPYPFLPTASTRGTHLVLNSLLI